MQYSMLFDVHERCVKKGGTFVQRLHNLSVVKITRQELFSCFVATPER